jgi:ABC-type dipeptide/oligopeptide/nickel transport system ATPase component
MYPSLRHDHHQHQHQHQHHGEGAVSDDDDDDATKNTDNDDSNSENAELLRLLDQVQLGDLATKIGRGDSYAGLDAVVDWSKVLSLGEQQRLAFARVLYNAPSLVVLDESTSALPLETEKAMYVFSYTSLPSFLVCDAPFSIYNCLSACYDTTCRESN